MSKKCKSKNELIDMLKTIRNEWPEGINPVTKVIPDKKKEMKRGKLKYKLYKKEENNEEI